jgi:hypothetical protein
MEMDDQVALFVVKQQSLEEILSIITNIQINSFLVVMITFVVVTTVANVHNCICDYIMTY